MNDTSTDHPIESSAPPEGAEVLVGQVNATFDPLRPEDIAPVAPETDAIENEPPAEETPPPAPPASDNAAPPLETTTASSDGQGLGCLRDLLLVLVSMVLGAALALLLLLGLNGTLFLNDRERAAALEVGLAVAKDKQAEMETQINAHQSAIATLEAQWQETDARVQALESEIPGLKEDQQKQLGEIAALQTRSDEIEQATESVQQDVADVSAHLGSVQDDVAELDETVTSMKSDIDDVRKTAERFDRFVQGLVTLLADVAPQQIRAGQTMTTTTPTPADAPEPLVESTPSSVTPAEPEAETATPQQLFPPRRPIPTPRSGSGVIFGLIWEDANGDGQPDANETILPGARVMLMDADGNPLLSMITGVDGRFAFIDMPPGDYQLQASPPVEHDLIAPDVQTVTVAPDKTIEINIGLTPP